MTREMLPLRFAQGFDLRAKHDSAVDLPRYLSLITRNARPLEDERVLLHKLR